MGADISLMVRWNAHEELAGLRRHDSGSNALRLEKNMSPPSVSPGLGYRFQWTQILDRPIGEFVGLTE